MTTWTRTWTVVVLALTATLPIVAKIVPANDATIAEVTVFLDRAEVVRQARVELPAGPSSVVFAEIPYGVETDSIRVTAEGVPATLGAVEIRERAEEPVESEEFLAARTEVRSLEREGNMLDRADAVDKELWTFLTSIRAATAERESKKLVEGGVDPQAIANVYTILGERMAALTKTALEREQRRIDLAEEIELARARLATLRPRGDIRSRIAVVEIEAREAGPLSLRLAYVVPGASWRPTYRASLDAQSGNVTLVSEGVVRQNTGEDWRKVRLRLSTASPARGVEPPMLTPWVLEIPTGRAVGGFASAEAPEADRYYQNVLDLAPGVADARGEPSEVAEAGVVRSAYNVAFEVPGAAEVPADGSDHRVVLRSESLAGKLVWRTVPALDSRAFLTSVTTAPRDYPLLAGRVRVFAGGAHLGSYSHEEKGPGVELTLPFGVDNRVEVIRVPLPRSKSREGFTGKQVEIEYGFKTQIHNLQDRAITMILEDRLPVSEDERITVELGEETTPGYRDSERRPGVKLWTLELGPGEKREVLLVYSVRHPRELWVPGLR